MIDASPKPMYINGEWVFAEGGATFDVINPADQSTVASIANGAKPEIERAVQAASAAFRDRKSTRLNSSHSQISYAVFCLKKKKKNTYDNIVTDHTTYRHHHTTLVCDTECFYLDVSRHDVSPSSTSTVHAHGYRAASGIYV